jgi:hypothetical protein
MRLKLLDVLKSTGALLRQHVERLEPITGKNFLPITEIQKAFIKHLTLTKSFLKRKNKKK